MLRGIGEGRNDCGGHQEWQCTREFWNIDGNSRGLAGIVLCLSTKNGAEMSKFLACSGERRYPQHEGCVHSCAFQTPWQQLFA